MWTTNFNAKKERPVRKLVYKYEYKKDVRMALLPLFQKMTVAKAEWKKAESKECLKKGEQDGVGHYNLQEN